MRTMLFAAIIAVVGSACYGDARVGARATVVASTPDLVYVGPDVYVVADYAEPVFYASNYYWLYYGGVWYRSRSYTGGWQLSYDVPVAVRSIDRPASYVHMRGHANLARREPVVRDHRDAPPQQSGPKPHPRDHGR
jgi:hypothetical protein